MDNKLPFKEEYAALTRRENRIYQERKKLNQKVIGHFALHEGDTVRIKCNTGRPDPRGDELVGQVCKIDEVRVSGVDGRISYTTNARDSRGLRWCWERNELELIERAQSFQSELDRSIDILVA